MKLAETVSSGEEPSWYLTTAVMCLVPGVRRIQGTAVPLAAVDDRS